ncbi:hypothetical protein HDU91_001015 [Kappamyces sp. JEL0680]|nr:hypothetical protein HDU91_001015 [Kappamyces sp. JEL0680]
MLPNCHFKIDVLKFQYAGREHSPRNQLQLILYCAECEKIGLKQSTSDFYSSDKHGLARSLWLTHRSNQTALRLICGLCFDYQIQDDVLLANALQALSELGDHNYILDSAPKILPNNTSTAISRIFEEILAHSVTAWASSAEKKWELLLCYLSVLGQYSFDGLVLQLKTVLADAAAAAPDADGLVKVLYAMYSLYLLKELESTLQARDTAFLLSVLAAIQDEQQCRAVLPFCQDCVFSILDDRSDYIPIAEAGLLDEFVGYVIAQDSIERLVDASLSQQKFDEASQLFRLYFATHPMEQSQDYADSLSIWCKRKGYSHPQWSDFLALACPNK